MKEKFQNYLIAKGYSQYTRSGKPSTVYDYCKRIDHVCAWEHLDWFELKHQISAILPQYEQGGEKSELGSKSHGAVRAALKCFWLFSNE